MKCPSCASDIPDESRFCLKCGKDVAAPAQPETVPHEDEDVSMFAMMCMAFSFMLFFFALVPFFMGYWIAGIAMLCVGVVLMLAGYRMIRVSKKEHMEMLERKAREQRELLERKSVKIKCRYCGSLNEEHAQKCHSCGAGL